MGGACSKQGTDEKCIWHFGSKTLRGRDNSEDLGIDKKIKLEWILGKWEGVDSTDLFQDRDYRRAAENTAMNLWVP
jgi:hypothetical protein